MKMITNHQRQHFLKKSEKKKQKKKVKKKQFNIKDAKLLYKVFVVCHWPTSFKLKHDILVREKQECMNVHIKYSCQSNRTGLRLSSPFVDRYN